MRFMSSRGRLCSDDRMNEGGHSPRMSSNVACSWSCNQNMTSALEVHVTASISVLWWRRRRLTHVEDGDDGRVVSADDGGNVLGLWNLRGDQLEDKEEKASEEAACRLEREDEVLTGALTMIFGGTKSSPSQATRSISLSSSQSTESSTPPSSKVPQEAWRSPPGTQQNAAVSRRDEGEAEEHQFQSINI